MPLKMNASGWDETLKSIVKNHLSPRAERIAEACDEALKADPPSWASKRTHTDGGYQAGTEGVPARQLKKRSYRATVITATYEAMYDNAANNTLVNNFSLAEE